MLGRDWIGTRRGRSDLEQSVFDEQHRVSIGIIIHGIPGGYRDGQLKLQFGSRRADISRVHEGVGEIDIRRQVRHSFTWGSTFQR